ncbi:MAG: c-type cytochrome [Acidobacteria bacterium]|nr:c-type cytochrome [Acidobacteriota bacterium]
MRNIFGGLMGLVVMIGLVALSEMAAQEPRQALVERGKYLVERVSMCIDCHTPQDKDGNPDPTRWLEGAPFPGARNDPNMASYAPPIAGLPGWNEQDAIRFLETGKRPNGAEARPPMPPYRLNREDAEAAVAYLKSLKRPSQ